MSGRPGTDAARPLIFGFGRKQPRFEGFDYYRPRLQPGSTIIGDAVAEERFRRFDAAQNSIDNTRKLIPKQLKGGQFDIAFENIFRRAVKHMEIGLRAWRAADFSSLLRNLEAGYEALLILREQAGERDVPNWSLDRVRARDPHLQAMLAFFTGHDARDFGITREILNPDPDKPFIPSLMRMIAVPLFTDGPFDSQAFDKMLAAFSKRFSAKMTVGMFEYYRDLLMAEDDALEALLPLHAGHFDNLKRIKNYQIINYDGWANPITIDWIFAAYLKRKNLQFDTIHRWPDKFA